MDQANDTCTATDPLQILISARDLIADEKRWNQGCFAVDGNGASVHSRSPSAVRWCGAGAIHKFTTPGSSWDYWTMLNAASRALYKRGISLVNDNIGHDAIMRVYDFAIETFSKPVP